MCSLNAAIPLNTALFLIAPKRKLMYEGKKKDEIV